MGITAADLLGFSERFLRPEFAALEEERRRAQPRWGRFFGGLLLLLAVLGVVRAFLPARPAFNLMLGAPIAIAILGGAVKVFLLERAYRAWQRRVGLRIAAPLARVAHPAVGLQFPPSPGFAPVSDALFASGERLRDEARWTAPPIDVRVGELRSHREDGGYGTGTLLTFEVPARPGTTVVRRRTAADRLVGLLVADAAKTGQAAFDDAFVLKGEAPSAPVLGFLVGLAGRWTGGISFETEGGRAWLLLRGRALMWPDLHDFHRPLEEKAYLERFHADLELLAFAQGLPR